MRLDPVVFSVGVIIGVLTSRIDGFFLTLPRRCNRIVSGGGPTKWERHTGLNVRLLA